MTYKRKVRRFLNLVSISEKNNDDTYSHLFFRLFDFLLRFMFSSYYEVDYAYCCLLKLQNLSKKLNVILVSAFVFSYVSDLNISYFRSLLYFRQTYLCIPEFKNSIWTIWTTCWHYCLCMQFFKTYKCKCFKQWHVHCNQK